MPGTAQIGAKAGDWLDINYNTDAKKIEITGINEELTENTKERIENKMDKLRNGKGASLKNKDGAGQLSPT